MKRTFKAAVAATLVLGTASVARADQTINGAIGLPLNPTAQIPLPGGVRIQGNYYRLDSDNNFYGVYAAGRIADTPLEINGGFEKLDSDFNGFNKSGIAIGAKYLFTRETDTPGVGVRIAAGAGYSRALLKNVHGYVVASKYFGTVTGERVPITGHLGLRFDRFDIFDDNESKFSVYGGVEVPVTRNGNLTFVGELQTKNVDGGSMPYSASVRYRPGQGLDQPFSASVGIVRHGLTDDSGLFAQIGYSFDTSP